MTDQALVEKLDTLADRIGHLADSIDELVGSNVELYDLMARHMEQQESESGESGGPVYLDDPPPPEAESDA